MMDLTTALIGLVIVALCVLPIVYFQIAQKKERNNFLKRFMELAKQQQIAVSTYDVWGHFYATGMQGK